MEVLSQINASMASFKPILFFILVSFLNFTTTTSQDLTYLYHNCSSNSTPANSTFQLDLRALLSSLSSKVKGNTQFYNTTVAGRDPSDSVYGLFMCRGDVPAQLCGQCVGNATRRLSRIHPECFLSEEAVIWFDECMVRYSNQNFFSKVATEPGYVLSSSVNVSSKARFNRLMLETMDKTVDEAANSSLGAKKYATGEASTSIFQNLYCLAQCTQDLSPQDCKTCLTGLIERDLPRCCAETQGGRVMNPSCNIRFDISPFYQSLSPASAPALVTQANSTNLGEKRKGRSRTIILIVVPIVVLAMLLCVGSYLLRRKASKSYKTILRENFGHESTALEPLQFDLAIIEAATNNFSHDNKIGKGGFGEVYKGILPDGRHIAVKRLSRSSRQGATEFKNEILLIAKLQHKNLVAFIGFCLEKQEKILVYEYVTNGSLDRFLFDTQWPKLLSWSKRYQIIGGIARGILYLHEYSRLKVIHRDLKPSNVLLDENMNSKISDFSLARIIEMDQDQGSTNKIVGTYGYMSPKYAMLGQFSEKSDIFSFGVMVLEIITGKKNVNSYESRRVADSLLSNVWRQWLDQTPLSILDPIMEENYSQIEVIRCIQIGLLCVQENPDARPTMVEVVSYLSSHSIELPSPQEPAFFLHGKMDAKKVAHESNSSQSANSSTPFSINEISTSGVLPR